MHVLVTGAAGFSGPHIVEALLAKGHRVTALIRSKLGRLVDVRQPRQGLAVLRGDLSSGMELPRELDAVVHAAARSPVPGVTDEHMMRDNVVATENLIAHARSSGVQTFIFF